MTEDDNAYVFHVPPPPIGYWVLPGGTEAGRIKFSAYSKPNLLHRLMMRWLMGWKWEGA
jgi:hypothetical protein